MYNLVIKFIDNCEVLLFHRLSKKDEEQIRGEKQEKKSTRKGQRYKKQGRYTRRIIFIERR